MTPTEQYIDALSRLKAGYLSLLRSHAGQRLDESVDGFDLFSGIWWPLRQQYQRAPRREVAWLVAKLYALCPVESEPGASLAHQLGRSEPTNDDARKAYRQRFDHILRQPLVELEPSLRWALDELASKNLKLDWVQLTDDLSIWEREATRTGWAEIFLGAQERN